MVEHIFGEFVLIMSRREPEVSWHKLAPRQGSWAALLGVAFVVGVLSACLTALHLIIAAIRTPKIMHYLIRIFSNSNETKLSSITGDDNNFFHLHATFQKATIACSTYKSVGAPLLFRERSRKAELAETAAATQAINRSSFIVVESFRLTHSPGPPRRF